MRHHNNDPHDALNDYLDAHTGFAPADSRAGELDPDVRDGVERFLDLAERAGAIPGATTQRRRPAMNATLPVGGSLSTPARAARKKRPNLTLPTWTRHLHMVSTGLLMLAVVALSFAAFGPNSPGGGGDDNGDGSGDGSGQFAAVPVATVPDDAVTSSIPYPGPEECTVEPMAREELIARIQEANVATEPELQLYERSIEPSDEDAEAIMQTFRESQACSWDTQGFGFAYEMQLQTPWYTANHLPVFYNYELSTIERPISEEEIEAYADVLLTEATPVATSGTPPQMQEEEVPEQLPIPDGATPVVLEGGRAFQTLFAEDIIIIGPNTATAQLYFVDEKTREVQVSDPLVLEFVKVDGQWLLHSSREGGPQG